MSDRAAAGQRPGSGPAGFRISRDRHDVDVDRVHRWLAEQSYWANGRSREAVVRSVEGSRTWSVLAPDGDQVAFARAVTDGATFAWLCDVFVAGDHRGRGIGGWLVGTALADLTDDGVPRVLLATKDAHEVYRRTGFHLVDAGRYMERRVT